MLIWFHFTCLELDVLLQSFFTIPSFWREYVSLHFVHHSLNISVTFPFFLSLFVEVFSDLCTISLLVSIFSWSLELLMLITISFFYFLRSIWLLFKFVSQLIYDFFFFIFFKCFNHIYFTVSFCSILNYSIFSNCWHEDLLFIDSIQSYFNCKRQKIPRKIGLGENKLISSRNWKSRVTLALATIQFRTKTQA